MGHLKFHAGSNTPEQTRECHPSATLLCLPIELLLHCLTLLPDIDSLKNATMAHSTLYKTFAAYKNSTTTAVLKNNLDHEIYAHAVVNHFLTSGRSVRRGHLLRNGHFSSYLSMTKYYRDAAEQILFSPAAATAIYRLHRKVQDICNLLLGDTSNVTDVFPLYDTLRFRNPSFFERVRVQRAIYLFHILAEACGSLRAGHEWDTAQLEPFLDGFQNCLFKSLIAPWELCQVVAIQGFFRRALVKILREKPCKTISSEVIQAFFGSGLNSIHRVLCVAASLGSGYFAALSENQAYEERGYAFDTVVTQAMRTVKSRTWPQHYNEYEPFGQNDELGFRTWRKLEERHTELFDNAPFWTIALQPELAILVEHFGFWGTAFWDDDRWDDVIHAVAQSHLEYWLHTPYESDPEAIETLILEEALDLEVI